MKKCPTCGAEQRRCLHCGALFPPAQAKQRFCSDSCRVMAHRKAQRADAKGAAGR